MEAFYLKYRPQTLNDLIGQEAVKKTLASAYANSKLSHAYLLVGPRGTGKTSTARILAKMVNCESLDDSDKSVSDKKALSAESSTTTKILLPCNKCQTCISITDGSNLDLIEIDAASNRGIEDIRALRERIKLAPTSAKKKVYIIDEVHMLTQEAFNALLKTLEEPPAHVLFILATTEVVKIPQTILSRAVRLDFELAIPDQLNQALAKIIKSEGIDIEEEALKLLIDRSEGSFRDAIKLLDQLSSLNKRVTVEDVIKNLHGVTFEEVHTLLKNLASRDSKAALLQIKELIDGGTDIKILIVAIMGIMRKLLLIKNGLGEELVKKGFFSKQYDSLVELEDRFSLKDLTFDLNVFQEALEKLKFPSILSLPLELAVVEICGEETEKQQVHHQPKALEKPPSTINQPSSKLDETTSLDILKLKEKWTFVLETVKPYNFSLEALLRSIKISECTDTTVILEVPYSFHQRILEAPKNKDLLEAILSDILGRQVRVSIVLGSRPTKEEDIANVEVAADDEIIRIAAEIFNSEPN